MARLPYNPSTDWTRGTARAIAPFLKTAADARTLLDLVLKEKHEIHYPPVNYVTDILLAWADMDEAGAQAAAAACGGSSTQMLRSVLTHHMMLGRPRTEANADEWLELLSKDSRPNEMKEIVKGLMSADMSAAGRWLLKHDPAISRESMRPYLEILTWRDPATALTYVESLPETGWEEQSPVRMVAQWAVESPAATNELLENQGWSEARISALKDRMAVQHPQAAQWWWDW
jgi:hypothetical protein